MLHWTTGLGSDVLAISGIGRIKSIFGCMKGSTAIPHGHISAASTAATDMPKVALVTGGASGIGRAACLGFAKLGVAVVIADVDDAGARETLRQVSGEDLQMLLQQQLCLRCTLSSTWSHNEQM